MKSYLIGTGLHAVPCFEDEKKQVMADMAGEDVSIDSPLLSRIVALIASGAAVSRIDLARELGLAPSTVSLRIQELTALNVITEDGAVQSTGGRRARKLTLVPDGATILLADLGGNHIRLALADMAGQLREVAEYPHDIGRGPESSLRFVLRRGRALADGHGGSSRIKGLGISLPGPVDFASGAVTTPSRMPGWRGFGVREWLTKELAIPVVVDNDANLMAYGEHFAHGASFGSSVTIKAGTAIGAGVVIDNRVLRGATNASGDITHVRVASAGQAPCSCGNQGCLETIASGAALTRILQEAGTAVASTADVVALARLGDPVVTTAVRSAGSHLGEVLCTVVNFINPDAVFLGGALSSLQPFVAAVRSELYQGCHPLATERLTIARTSAGKNAGILGATRLTIDAVLSSSSVNSDLESSS